MPENGRAKAGNLVVVGSLNMDLVVRVVAHPKPGETVLGSDYETHPGGKGANQAVAAARMGAKVRMVGRVGTDEFGHKLRQGLEREGINAHATLPIQAPTGVALIALDQAGQNTIIVSPGANSRLRPENLRPAEFDGAKVVALQLEIPLQTVKRAAELAREVGAMVVLNAAPAPSFAAKNADQALPKQLLSLVQVLVINETEAEALSGQQPDSPETAQVVAELLQESCPTVIITLGANGVIWASPEGKGYQPSFKVQVVDTTAAGDGFIGALVTALSEGQGLAEAVRLGAAAGALTVTKMGAQPSLPHREAVENFLASNLS